MKIVDKVKVAYEQDAAAREAAHRYKGAIRKEDDGKGGASADGGPPSITAYPTMEHGGKGLWQPWDGAVVRTREEDQ